jgi:chromate reductase
MSKHKIAVVVGGLSRQSINRQLAAALTRLAGDAIDVTWVRIDDLPLFNQDIETPAPAPVARLRAEIAAADGVLMVTPEYHRSIPPALKNAIDWAARPYGHNAWAGKPVAIAGTSPGAIATAAAQQHLRHILTVLDMAVMGQPEAYVTWKPGLFEADGTITDEGLRQYLQGFVDRFIGLVDRLTATPHRKAVA